MLTHFSFQTLFFVVIMNEAEKTEFLKRMGEQIKQAREKNGMTPAELARKTGTERSTVARMEGGRTNPTAVTLKLICDALDISFVDLFEGFNHRI
jgi:transcriptional regulator with XRE-family HTH domain